ncbi:hypothetical protein [Leptospira interrogans]|uniref:Uncharacterized protein n=1 Tax=Leptospira interrogans serovar Grippotyphosa str. LT2186 TaxID=1001599 RepID=M3IA78_LEPIR|nr:hypothetical protein [Leptospira interrogans]EMG12747.1 hypothetical protein LEP1GSC151_2507 [Leptospira interrogans serovar Grippotyphosa str. LT2186]EKR44237.1 hypothetical protein LEP1GSC097_2343 [Leptospira interrogans serovar Grippotyphosa str. UI 08368]EMN69198.1 hypothetical protein LEP1GSC098_1141 [Leptospira interrogans serovar Grippotyphosa str. UI 08434]EMN78869.1 hypothetical protein LEP1GSC106_2052 [Leptospira interrogans serovar Grippotyphosa str. UI 12764]EMN86407.1 hypotheti
MKQIQSKTWFVFRFSLIQEIDHALHYAKKNERNQVVHVLSDIEKVFMFELG